LLQSFGHTVKLISPQLVKPYVKRGKNDAADAEALCEAMSRPTMRFVPVKSPEQQAALMLVSVRDRLIRNRTQLANAIRGHAAQSKSDPHGPRSPHACVTRKAQTLNRAVRPADRCNNAAEPAVRRGPGPLLRYAASLY